MGNETSLPTAKNGAARRSYRLATGRYDSLGSPRVQLAKAGAADLDTNKRGDVVDESMVVDLIEVWFRPLRSALASNVFGGKHSFTVVRLEGDKSYFQIEKLHDGTVSFRKLTREDVLQLAIKKCNSAQNGFVKAKHALKTTGNGRSRASHVRKNVTVRALRQIVKKHTGHYQVHDANCHKLSTDLWNAVVVEEKELEQQFQSTLSYLASFLGVNASMASHANTPIQNATVGLTN